MKPPVLFFSAGDLSGDLHCSLLLRELARRHPDWEMHAVGGQYLRGAGAQMAGDSTGLGLIGLGPSLLSLPRQVGLHRRARAVIERERPAVAILCDWGAVNARTLPFLRALNIPTLYYFPPRSWQKHGSAGMGIAPLCDRIATPFEWSAQRLNAAGGRAEWVGHPLLETAPAALRRPQLRADMGVGETQTLVALLPGSRALEQRFIAPHVAEAVRLLRERHDCVFAVAAPPGGAAGLRRWFGPEVLAVEGRTSELLLACDVAIVKSGTSTLEAAVAGAPQVAVYEAPYLLHLQVQLTGLRRKIPFVAMPNIVLERAAVPELLGEACRGAPIAAEVGRLLDEPERAAAMRADYDLVRAALGENLPYTATHRTADLVEELVDQHRA